MHTRARSSFAVLLVLCLLAGCHNFSLARVPQVPTESEIVESSVKLTKAVHEAHAAQKEAEELRQKAATADQHEDAAEKAESAATGEEKDQKTKAEKVAAAAAKKADTKADEAESRAKTAWSRTNAGYVYKDAPGSFHTAWFASSDAYCRNVMYFGQQTYRRFGWAGGIVSILGAAGTAAATAWAASSSTDDKDDKAGLAGKIGLAAGTAVLTAGGLYMVNRAIAASRASGAAGIALGPDYDPDTETVKIEPQGCKGVPTTCTTDDEWCLKCNARRARSLQHKRWQTCLDARGAWLGGNSEALLALSGPKAEDKAKDEKKDDDAKDEVKRPEALNSWIKDNCKTAGTTSKCWKCSNIQQIPPSFAAYFVSKEYDMDKMAGSSGQELCQE